VVRALLREYGTTYAEQAAITLKDAPSPLYRLLVLCTLLSARISADVGVAAAQALSSAGLRTAKAMREATWQHRVEVLGAAGYRRFDERTATMLGDGADLVQEQWGGDLRRMHEAAPDVDALRKLLQEVPGIGPLGSAIFCREVQGIWPDVAPFVDDKVKDGARLLGLPTSEKGITGLVEPDDLPRLAAACVRVALNKHLADELTAGR
jgi:hypothetical protein